MNFSRFPRGNMFDFRREPAPRDAQPPSEPEDTARLPSPGPSALAPPVLTRPRTGTMRDPVEDLAAQAGPMDSLTLGQLKAHTAGMQTKQKVWKAASSSS